MTVKSQVVTVATSAPVNETQTITVGATGGTFTLAFGGDPTTDIAFDATSATIEAALEALDEFAPADVSVSGDGPHLVTFAGAYAGTNVALLTVDDTLATGGEVTIAQTTPGSPRTSPQRLDIQAEQVRNGRFVTLKNSGDAAVFLGGSDVTASTGFPLASTAQLGPIELADEEALYAVTADGGSEVVYVLETGR